MKLADSKETVSPVCKLVKILLWLTAALIHNGKNVLIFLQVVPSMYIATSILRGQNSVIDK